MDELGCEKSQKFHRGNESCKTRLRNLLLQNLAVNCEIDKQLNKRIEANVNHTPILPAEPQASECSMMKMRSQNFDDDLRLQERVSKRVATQRVVSLSKPMRRPVCSAAEALKAGKSDPKSKEFEKVRIFCDHREESIRLKTKEVGNVKGYKDSAEVACKEPESEEPSFLKTDLGGCFLRATLVFKAWGVGLNKPVGITQLQSGNIVVADTFNDRMVMFNSNGKFLKKFSDQIGLHRPSSVVALVDGSFAIKDSNKILVFSESCKFKGSFKLLKSYGLTLNEEGNLVTVETQCDGILVVVTVDPESCKLLSKIYVDLCLKPWNVPQSKPRYITWQGANRLLVVDKGLDCVYVVDTVAEVLLERYGEHSQLAKPSGIMCDGEGFILLGDSQNHQILLLSPDGTSVSVVKMDVSIRQPSGLHLTSDGNLLVLSSLENSLSQYSLELIEE